MVNKSLPACALRAMLVARCVTEGLGKRMRCIGLIVLAVLASAAPALADVDVVISKSQQQMVVTVDGGPSYRWPVSTGRSGYDTPEGNFSAIRLERVYFSKKYDDAPMPNSVFFHGGYAIHGTFEEGRLGNAVSHGCVRLARENAAVLYAAVKAQGIGHTHIRITDGPVYGGPPVVARGDGERRYRDSDETNSRRYGRTDGRGYRAGPVYHGFEEYEPPRDYRQPSRRVYWDSRRWYRVERGDAWQ
jgi:hypothetical protein